MRLLVAAPDGQGKRVIHDASNLDKWPAIEGLSVVEVPGDTETYAWPNGARSACLLEADGTTITVNPAWVAPPQGRDFLKLGVLPNIEGANNSARLTRLASVMNVDRSFADFFHVCNTYAVLSSGDHTFIRKLWALKRASGGLTSGEVTAIQAAAPTYGITLP